jgi:hypothetical protein
MLPKYPSARNITTIERLLVEPELRTLALCFLNAFLPFKVVHFEADTYSSLRLFHAAGTFHDDIIVKIEDNAGALHFVEIALLHMRPGNTWGYFKADRDYQYKFRETKGTHYAGRRVHCLYFMQFETDIQSGYHIEKRYDFKKAPYSVRFDCFELPKFTASAPDLCTDRDRWLYWLRNDHIPSGWEKELLPLTDWKHWNDDGREDYQRRTAWAKERWEKEIKEGKDLDPRYLQEPATEVIWNWLFMEKQIGALPKRKVKPAEIDLTTIAEQLPAFAFKLFRGWSVNCKAKHPNIHLTLESEHLLPKDLQQTLCEAVIEVFNYDQFYLYNCNTERGAIYLNGHLHGILSKHWYLEYVIKLRDDFKTCMALRCLSAWMKLEDVQSLKIDDLYDQIMRSKVNLADIDTSISKVDLKDHKGRVLEPNEGTGKVHTVIENLLHQYINKVSAVEIEDFMPKISEVIDFEIFAQLIECNKPLFLD